jgi:SAM-dependent methyltransferase
MTADRERGEGWSMNRASADRALSFGTVSEDYDRFRPGPPSEVLDWLLPTKACAAVDVGAGTGALTRLLVRRVQQITAVEPDQRMRRVLAERVPEAIVREGAGEAIPVDDGTQDAVLASSSWHWVDPRRAVAEAARVLRPAGILGVVWTCLDLDVDWVDDLDNALRPGCPQTTSRRESRHLEIPDGSVDSFCAVEGPHRVRFVHRFTRDTLVGLASTYSALIIQPPAQRAALLSEVRSTLEADPRFADPAGVEVPMVSRCFRAQRAAPKRDGRQL